MSDAFEFGRSVKQAAMPDFGGIANRAMTGLKNMGAAANNWSAQNLGLAVPNAAELGKSYSDVATGAKNFYEWGKTPIGATQYAKEKGLTDLPYAQQEQAWRKTQPPSVSPEEFRKEYESALYDYFHKSQRNSTRNTPEDQWSRALLSPARLLYHGGRGVAAAADAASDVADGSWKNWELFAPVRKTYDNVDKGVESARKIVSGVEDASKQVSAPPEELAAAKATPAPTMGNYLADSFKSNPLWLLPAAGLGGLGAYGIYKLLNARRDAKKRRRLMSPAAITY